MNLTDEEKRLLADPWWRLSNIYSIVTDDSVEMRFTPNPEQEDLYRSLWFRMLILKARQLGFTTFIDLLALDQCLFNANFTAVVIADSLPNAEKIFRKKIAWPYDKLPRLIRDITPTSKQTTSELLFGNNSSIAVTTSARSGTTNLLHISEMGKIARKYPEKAREIVTGSFESVPKTGMIFVESTAEGHAGWFHDTVMDAHRRQLSGAKETELDWRLKFYPWWSKPTYTLDPDGVVFTKEQIDYFANVELKLKRKLSMEQRAWYVKKQSTLKDDMKREHPATVAEAFEQSTEGYIYAKELLVLRALGRIGKVELRPGIAVNTFWDLGVNDINAIWMHQRVGSMNRFLKYIFASNEGMAYYWRELEKWRESVGAVWGKHYLPHDGDARIQGYEVTTRKQILEECGARNVEIVGRTPDLRTAIDLVKRILPECEFDEEGCVDGLSALENYSREWDEHRGTWASQPRHDQHSNGSDAFRQFAQAYNPSNDTPRPVMPAQNYGRAGY